MRLPTRLFLISARLSPVTLSVLGVWLGALVVEPSALAQTFLQSDLTGTWRLHSKSVPNLPGQIGGWSVGSVTFDAAGRQTPGNTTIVGAQQNVCHG